MTSSEAVSSWGLMNVEAIARIAEGSYQATIVSLTIIPADQMAKRRARTSCFDSEIGTMKLRIAICRHLARS